MFGSTEGLGQAIKHIEAERIAQEEKFSKVPNQNLVKVLMNTNNEYSLPVYGRVFKLIGRASSKIKHWKNYKTVEHLINDPETYIPNFGEVGAILNVLYRNLSEDNYVDENK